MFCPESRSLIAKSTDQQLALKIRWVSVELRMVVKLNRNVGLVFILLMWQTSGVGGFLFGGGIRCTRNRRRADVGAPLETLRMSIISACPHRAEFETNKIERVNFRMSANPDGAFLYFAKLIANISTVTACIIFPRVGSILQISLFIHLWVK